MAFRYCATICVALALQTTVCAQEARLESAVTCLNDWWSTNERVLLKNPENQPLKDIMDNLNVQWISSPWSQLALDSGIGSMKGTPEAEKIRSEGFKCIECIRQLAIPPEHCNAQQ